MTDSALQPIVCCVGPQVAGNPRQYVMEKAFAAVGLDWRYLTLEVAADRLADAVRGACALGFLGANLTGAFRREAVERLDELAPAAARTGVVDCICRSETGLVGDDHTGEGFCRALGEQFDPAEKRVVLVGGGAMARSVAAALAERRVAAITVVNRTAERTDELLAMLKADDGPELARLEWAEQLELPSEIDLLINATDVGRIEKPTALPIDFDVIAPTTLVADLTYRPPRTELLRAAAARGCPTLGGVAVLLHRIALSFERWTAHDAPLDVMRESLEEFLEA